MSKFWRAPTVSITHTSSARVHLWVSQSPAGSSTQSGASGQALGSANLTSPSRLRSQRTWSEARKCFGIAAYKATAAMARRAVQGICIDKEAKKDHLVNQVKQLVADGRLHQNLAEWADEVRVLGNVGVSCTHGRGSPSENDRRGR